MYMFANVWITEEGKHKIREKQNSYGVDDADAL